MYSPNPYYRMDVAKAYRAEDFKRAQERAMVAEFRRTEPQPKATRTRARSWLAHLAHGHLTAHS